MKEKLLREGGIIEALDDVSEGSTNSIADMSGGMVYSMTSGNQSYSLSTLRFDRGGAGAVEQSAISPHLS